MDEGSALIPSELISASRPVLFHTDVEGHEIATWGGTLFLVEENGTPYALTAKHNLHDFAWRDLVVTNTRQDRRLARVRSVSYPTDGTLAAEGSDLLDLAVVQFAPEVTSNFFEGQVFPLADHSICSSEAGDDLIAYGALSEFSKIEDRKIRPVFGELGFMDCGSHKHDPILREGRAAYEGHPMTKLEGLSGAPIYNTSKNGLAGMMLRGGLRPDGSANMLYAEVTDILEVMRTVQTGEVTGSYAKTISRFLR